MPSVKGSQLRPTQLPFPRHAVAYYLLPECKKGRALTPAHVRPTALSACPSNSFARTRLLRS